MKTLSLSLIIIWCIIGTGTVRAGSHNKTIITLKEEITIASSVVYLRDIAEINGNNKVLFNMLSDVVVIRHPRPGALNVVSRSDIVSYINQKIKDAHKKISWKGKGYTRIYAVGQQIDSNMIKDVASNYLDSVMRDKYSDYEFKLKTELQDITIANGKYTLIPRMKTNRIFRRQCVWVDIEINNRNYQTIPVWYATSAFIKVPILKEDAISNSDVNVNNLEWVNVEVDSIDENIVFKPGTGSRLVFRKNIKAGEIITKNDVKQASDVMYGQIVQVTSHVGNVAVTVKAIADNDGNIGDVVNVRAMNGTGAIPARVVNKASVMVGS